MKALIGVITFFSSLFSVDPNGWVELERKDPSSDWSHVADEDDPSIWVLFSKKVKGEQFQVRFPHDPFYQLDSNGVWEALVEEGGESFSLIIEDRDSFQFDERFNALLEKPTFELLEMLQIGDDRYSLDYKLEGKWVREEIFLSPQKVYLLGVKSSHFHGENQPLFFDSFRLTF